MNAHMAVHIICELVHSGKPYLSSMFIFLVLHHFWYSYIYLCLQGRNSLLGENLTSAAPSTNHENESVKELESSINVEAQEEEMDVPEAIEEIIEQLLSGLRDKVYKYIHIW